MAPMNGRSISRGSRAPAFATNVTAPDRAYGCGLGEGPRTRKGSRSAGRSAREGHRARTEVPCCARHLRACGAGVRDTKAPYFGVAASENPTFSVHDWDFSLYKRVQARELERWREQLAKLGPGLDSIVDRLSWALGHGLNWLAGLDRVEPFWNHRNHLPTVGKLRDITSQILAATPHGPNPSVPVAWFHLAAHVLAWSGQLPGHPVWSLSPSRAIPGEWLVAAAWMEHRMWGNDALPMMPTVERLGRRARFADTLRGVAAGQDVEARAWARRELDAGSAKGP